MIDPMTAKRAFLRISSLPVEGNDAVRTGRFTELTSGTFLLVNEDNPIGALVYSPVHRTGR